MKKKQIYIFWTVVVLVVLGVFTLLSASITYLSNPDSFFNLLFNQIITILIGFFGIFLILKSKKINYLTLKQNSHWLFLMAFLIQLLVFIPFFSVIKNGSIRWIDLGVIIQPSEFFRFAFIIFVANILFTFKNELKEYKTFMKFTVPVVILLALFYWYIKDLGSLMILWISIFTMLWFTPLAKKIVLTALVVFLVASPLLMFSDHGKKRITTYYNSIFAPEKLDYSGDYYQNYNMIKAIGSGGIDGIGYGGSMQKFNKRLPESVSDSIFSIFAEEWGFIFTSLLIFLYGFLGWQIFSALTTLRNYYQKLVIVGLGTNILFPAYYNIMTVIGFAPLSGMPLTFISKGGTSMLFSLLSIGIILLFLKKN